MKSLFRVLSQTEPITINKQDGTQSQKSIITLQEFGNQFEDTFAATLLGNQIKFYEGDLVFCSLRFTIREFNQNIYQDVTIQAITKAVDTRSF